MVEEGARGPSFRFAQKLKKSAFRAFFLPRLQIIFWHHRTQKLSHPAMALSFSGMKRWANEQKEYNYRVNFDENRLYS